MEGPRVKGEGADAGAGTETQHRRRSSELGASGEGHRKGASDSTGSIHFDYL